MIFTKIYFQLFQRLSNLFDINRYLNLLNKVVVRIDRKNKLATEDIMCGLIEGDPGESIFKNPKNEDE